jgi:sortase A
MRRIVFCALVFLALVTLGGVIASCGSSEVASEKKTEEEAETSTAAPEHTEENTGDEQSRAAEQADAEKAAAEQASGASRPEVPPSSSVMSLSIPKLGISGVSVVDDVSEAGLSQGVGHMPGTGFPWQKGSNTWIAGHRLGYPGTPSDHIFFNLPSLAPGDIITLSDSNGRVYTYRVSEILQLLPTEMWATEPVPGRDVVSLQTCIENFGDFATLGPNWNVRLIVRGDRIG